MEGCGLGWVGFALKHKPNPPNPHPSTPLHAHQVADRASVRLGCTCVCACVCLGHTHLGYVFLGDALGKIIWPGMEFHEKDTFSGHFFSCVPLSCIRHSHPPSCGLSLCIRRPRGWDGMRVGRFWLDQHLRSCTCDLFWRMLTNARGC